MIRRMTQRHLAIDGHERSRTPQRGSRDQCAGRRLAGATPVQLLGVGLDDTSAGLGDCAQNCGEGCACHAVSTVLPPVNRWHRWVINVRGSRATATLDERPLLPIALTSSCSSGLYLRVRNSAAQFRGITITKA